MANEPPAYAEISVQGDKEEGSRATVTTNASAAVGRLMWER